MINYIELIKIWGQELEVKYSVQYFHQIFVWN